MTKEQLREFVESWYHTAYMETPGDIGDDNRQALAEVLVLLTDEPKCEHYFDPMQESGSGRTCSRCGYLEPGSPPNRPCSGDGK